LNTPKNKKAEYLLNILDQFSSKDESALNNKSDLLDQANECCKEILESGQLVQNEIEKTRTELLNKNLNLGNNAGDSINFITEFYKTLQKTESYKNFQAAKDSFLNLSLKSENNDIEQIVEHLLENNVISYNSLKASYLHNFNRKFQEQVNLIESKIQEQVRILKIQVHYAVSGDSQSVQENLKKLIHSFFTNKSEVANFLKENPLSINSGLTQQLGGVKINNFYYDEVINEGEIVRNSMNSGEDFAILESLRKNEEATLKKVLEKTHAILKEKEFVLKEYIFEYGLVEFIIIANIEYFAKEIATEKLEKIDVVIQNKNKTCLISGVDNRKYYIPGELYGS
jgi:hypothetical protein